MKFLMFFLCLASVSAFAQSPVIEFRDVIDQLTGGSHTLVGTNSKNNKPCEVSFEFNKTFETERKDYFMVVTNTKLKESEAWGTRYKTTAYNYDKKSKIDYAADTIIASHSHIRTSGENTFYKLTIHVEAGRIKSVVSTTWDYGGDLLARISNGKKTHQCHIL